MRNLPLRSSLFFLLFASFFTPGILLAQTNISGPISSNTTWGIGGSPYIVQDDVTVNEGVTLTIQAGVIIKFQDHYDDLFVNGRLIANGTAGSPVVFTSLIDDAHGGDTNLDGSATLPGPDQWGAIWFSASSVDNTLEHCWIGYGGGYYTSAMINTATSDLSIRNSTITYSAERGVYCDAASPFFENNHFIGNQTDGVFFNHLDKQVNLNLTNNTFTNNTNFAAIAVLSENESDISLVGNTSTGSAHNGFGLEGTINSAVVFEANPGFPFVIWQDLTVGEGAVLTFTPGTTVKFNDHYDDIFVNGSLIANGTSTDPITFTALADDTHDGDTNGDGVSDPAPDQWGAIWFNANSNNNLLEHCWIGYGGGYYTSAMIDVYTSDLTIRNSTIAYSAERGVYGEGASPLFEGNQFIGNQTIGIYLHHLDNEVDLELTNNTFDGNNDFAGIAILHENRSDITLSGNSSSGSSHNGFALQGTISGAVTFDANPGFPFVIWEDVTVNEGAALTFTPGTSVKFNDHYDDLFVHGSLSAVGTAASPVSFTALADDAHDGDANGDGSASEPGPDQWGAIWFHENSNNNILENCWIGYGGGYYTSGMMNVYTSELTIRNSTIAHSVERGVYVEGASPLFEGNHFIGNLTDGIFLNHLDNTVDLQLTNNVFTDNVNFAALAVLSTNESDITLVGNSSTGSAHNGFAIEGTINSAVVFDANPGFPFIIWNDVTVNEGAVLNFTPGTAVKFNDHYDDLFVHGSLNAAGTVAMPITFTCLADDAHDGDANGDGAASEPAGDQWGAIWFHETSTNNDLQHCWIGYGGGYYTSAMINVYTSDLSIRNSTIAYSIQRGIYGEGVSPVFEGNHFIGNSTDGLFILHLENEVDLLFTDNTFTDNSNFAALVTLQENRSDIILSGNSSTGSAHNGFAIEGTVNGSVVFDANPGFPFIIWNDVTINEGALLSFTPGTTVKFNDHYDDLFVHGSLNAVGTEVFPIIFTSLADDAHDGDTNGDALATEPAPDQWAALWFHDNSFNNTLEHCWIGYGGGYYTSAMINVYTSSLDIRYSTIAWSPERGFYLENASPLLEGNFIHNNAVGMFCTSQSLPTLIDNDIFDNSSHGIINGDSSVEVDARNTWWGDASGPYHPGINAVGLGNQVSDYVLFEPWLLAPSGTTNTEELQISKLGFEWRNISPNPFKAETRLEFSLTETKYVTIEVINTQGQVVETLFAGQLLPDDYTKTWVASETASGLYTICIRSAEGILLRKVIKI
jgi:hypothetical protein